MSKIKKLEDAINQYEKLTDQFQQLTELTNLLVDQLSSIEDRFRTKHILDDLTMLTSNVTVVTVEQCGYNNLFRCPRCHCDLNVPGKFSCRRACCVKCEHYFLLKSDKYELISDPDQYKHDILLALVKRYSINLFSVEECCIAEKEFNKAIHKFMFKKKPTLWDKAMIRLMEICDGIENKGHKTSPTVVKENGNKRLLSG